MRKFVDHVSKLGSTRRCPDLRFVFKEIIYIVVLDAWIVYGKKTLDDCLAEVFEIKTGKRLIVTLNARENLQVRRLVKRLTQTDDAAIRPLDTVDHDLVARTVSDLERRVFQNVVYGFDVGGLAGIVQKPGLGLEPLYTSYRAESEIRAKACNMNEEKREQELISEEDETVDICVQVAVRVDSHTPPNVTVFGEDISLDNDTKQWSAPVKVASGAGTSPDVNIGFTQTGIGYITYSDKANKLHLLKFAEK